MKKFLDNNGLSHLWLIIKSYVSGAIHNSTITIKMNNATKDTFTLNQSSDKAIDLGTVVTSETPLSLGTATGDGNAITSLSVSGHTITPNKGTTFLTSHQSVDNKGATLAWSTESTIATIGSTDIKVTMPANPDTDTKNTAGSTDTSSLIYIIGATSQADNPQTYSHDTAAVGTDGCLYSGGTNATNKVITVSMKGAASGVCPLDANSKVDSQYLPSYVDDVIEAYPRSGQTALSSTWLSLTSGGSALTPEGGKIYVLMADSTHTETIEGETVTVVDYAANSQFRWGSTTYVQLVDAGVSAITTNEIDEITSE